jgi:DNA replication and repair protein RecF
LDEAYGRISGSPEVVSFTYSSSWFGDSFVSASAGEYSDSLTEALESSRQVDYERRMTTVGPHRDEPGFSLEGRDARAYGSQGEQRTMALAVKLAAHSAVADTIGESPVLLLDDVFSELDPSRGSALAASLPSGTQTMITSARPEDVPLTGKTWNVSGGTIS